MVDEDHVCALFLGTALFFLCISIVNPFVFVVVVHAVDRRHAQFDWRTPKRLLILRTGDTANEHVVFGLSRHHIEIVTM